jgi:hypothetical protein
MTLEEFRIQLEARFNTTAPLKITIRLARPGMSRDWTLRIEAGELGFEEHGATFESILAKMAIEHVQSKERVSDIIRQLGEVSP